MVRSRFTIVAALVLLSLGLVVSSPVPASASDQVFAQDVGEGEDPQPGEEQDGGESAEEGSETGSETGPPWTYQMAWMGLGLAFAVIALIGFLYWRIVVRRARGVA